MSENCDNSVLDEQVLREIALGPKRFSDLKHLDPNDRAVDRSLQRLRKQGKVHYIGNGPRFWHLTAYKDGFS